MPRLLIVIISSVTTASVVNAFVTHQAVSLHGGSASLRKKSFLGNSLKNGNFDPLGLSDDDARWLKPRDGGDKGSEGVAANSASLWLLPVLGATAIAATPAQGANAASLSTAGLDPQNFQPVCPTSDGFYRFLQGTALSVVGKENFDEYAPLIAGGLLRVRLELCVVESFWNEAVGPFIKQNGLSWILPLHETVETFLAGTIFSLASTFILVGSTKIVSVVVTYADVFVGGPSRLLGGFAFDRARGKPVTLDIGFGPFKTRVIGPPKDSEEGAAAPDAPLVDFENTSPANLVIVFASGAVKVVGEVSKVLREFFEGLDLFVGRYLVLLATGYIGLKFLHYKVFPDFPPF